MAEEDSDTDDFLKEEEKIEKQDFHNHLKAHSFSPKRPSSNFNIALESLKNESNDTASDFSSK